MTSSKEPARGLELEQRLRQSEERVSQIQAELLLTRCQLEALLESFGDVAWIKDADQRYVAVNERFLRLVDRGRQEILGKRDDEVFSAPLAKTYQEHDRAVLETGQRTRASEEIAGADSRRLFETLRHPILAGESPVGLLGISREVTEQRTLERQLFQSQKMEAIGRLAGGIAHDFNNLLTALTGFSDLLLFELEPGDPRRGHAEEIRRAGERAAALTRQLLAFSRQQVLEPRVLDLNDIVASVGKMLHRLIGENIGISLDRAPDLWRVRADPGQMEQIIVNLAINARDAMPNGGKLTIGTRNTQTNGETGSKDSPAPAGEYVLLAVSDTGVGMTPEMRARAFEPFYTTKELGRGTGLGLATVYGIVKQSGGHIGLESEPGRGTVVEVFLPRTTAPVEVLEPSALVTTGRRGSETILLVEDEPGVRSLVRKLLGMHGYTVLEAGSPAEALALSASHSGQIDLLLTDVVLPEISGRKLAILVSQKRPGIRVLYMSGYSDESVLRQGLREEDSAFLQKPFSPAALDRKVREVLDAPSSASQEADKA